MASPKSVSEFPAERGVISKRRAGPFREVPANLPSPSCFRAMLFRQFARKCVSVTVWKTDGVR